MCAGSNPLARAERQDQNAVNRSGAFGLFTVALGVCSILGGLFESTELLLVV